MNQPKYYVVKKKKKWQKHHRLVTTKTDLKGGVVRPKEVKFYSLLFVLNKLGYNKDICTLANCAICVFTYSLDTLCPAGSSWRYVVVALDTA